jgi:deazaflavin-dependent oxidoreductase (nitroreductase family)
MMDPQERQDYNRRLIEQFRTSRDTAGGPMEGRPLLLLTTIGAKTGQRHTTPIMYIPDGTPGTNGADGTRLLVIASNAGAPDHPDWYRNLVAHPDVTVEVGNETYEARAVVLDGAEREQVWASIVAQYPFFAQHQAQITRQIPVVALEQQ